MRVITPPCWIDGMPEAEYRADPCDRPSLTQSLANVLLTTSPRHAWYEHPRLGGHASESSAEKDKGTAVHALVFGGTDRFAVLEVDDYRTKAARELRDAAAADGMIPVKSADWEECEQTAAAVRKALTEMDPGFAMHKARRERVAIWEESGVLCRARMDCVVGNCIYDLKTIDKATDESIERSIREYGYHVQRAAYVSAFEHIVPSMCGMVEFVLLFVEKGTGEVVPVEVSGTLCDIGERRWKRAVNAWGRCMKAGKWPGYAPNGPRRIDCSDWVRAKEEEDEHMLKERMRGI